MSDNRETIEALVKLEVLVGGLGGWIPYGPGTPVWLNAWLGPHWIIVPVGGSDVHMERQGRLVYHGPLQHLLDCRTVFDHRVGMKELDGPVADLTYALSFDLTTVLRRAGGRLESDELQSLTRDFFQQRPRVT